MFIVGFPYVFVILFCVVKYFGCCRWLQQGLPSQTERKKEIFINPRSYSRYNPVWKLTLPFTRPTLPSGWINVCEHLPGGIVIQHWKPTKHCSLGSEVVLTTQNCIGSMLDVWWLISAVRYSFGMMFIKAVPTPVNLENLQILQIKISLQQTTPEIAIVGSY